MQNKGIVKVFAIILALICLYELSFTFLAKGVESDAEEAFEANQVESVEKYLDSVAHKPVSSMLPESVTYKACKEKELNLGLDLKGGINVILEVSVEDLISNLVGDKNDATFQAAISRAKEMEKNSQEDFVVLFAQAFEEVSNGALLRDPKYFGTQVLSSKFDITASNEEVMKVVTKEVQASVDNAFTILRARIDKFGVAQPNIQRLQQSGRILIELPGVKDVSRVKKIVTTTAQLEFWETRQSQEIVPFLFAANERLRGTEKNPNETKEESTASSSNSSTKDSTANNASSNGDDEIDALLSGDNPDSTAVAQNDSIDPKEAFNPLFQVMFPNINQQTGQPGVGPVVAYAAKKDIPKVNEYLNRADVLRLLPSAFKYTKFAWTVKPIQEGQDVYGLLALSSNRNGDPSLSGDVIVEAKSYTEPTGEVVVSMNMNSVGAQKWKRITKNNIGKSVAVVLDDLVYSYPTVNQEIGGGSSQISGNFTIAEGQDLANILKAGKLPARARIIQAEEVGASLGQRAIDSGIISFVIALLIVLVYMIFYYAKSGIAANVALVANMFFIFGVLSSLGAVLTLPGIAGIVLTIGMAVDANVLIFERIKEELRLGKSQSNAIKDGFKHAYAAIIDANVTTLLTAIILYIFGTGPIRGFATTLFIGILTSLFSAIFITRLVLTSFAANGKKVSFFSSITKNLFQNNNVNFLSKKKIAYTISTLIIIGGLASIFTKGFDWGVDFTGGRSYVVSFQEEVKTDNVRKALGDVFVDKDGNKQLPIVKTFGQDNQVKITTKYRINDENTNKEKSVDDEVKETLESGLAKVSSSFQVESSQLVGPTIADDIKQSAVWSVLGSLLVIFLYILSRFGKWQYSLGAVVAVFHDVLIVLSIFSIAWGLLPFSLEIDQAFIAAILTVIGYSLNDTVVVFDRLRERLSGSKNSTDSETINRALNSTLSRTLNTSLTTLIVLLIIFFIGGEVIQGFMFALLVGVLVGTYSSLFIATPVMLDTSKKK
jgi:SecD/SecF fusion protein